MRLPALFALVAALLPAALHAQEGWGLRPVEYEGSPSVPAFADITDPASGLAGLPPLRDVVAPPGVREIRAWAGFGLIAPFRMVRVVSDGETTRGELFYWWSTLGDDADAPSFGRFGARMREAAGRHGCEVAQRGPAVTIVRNGVPSEQRGWIGICRVDLGESEPDWEALLARLESFEVFGLPRPEDLGPPEHGVEDGMTLQVETLEGDRYRTFTWSDPLPGGRTEARMAAGILRIVMEVGGR